MGHNNPSSNSSFYLKAKNYYATDYMLETILFVYCLLFINTFYLSKLDVSRNKFLLNSQNNNTTIGSWFYIMTKQIHKYKVISEKRIITYLRSYLRYGKADKVPMNIQSAENCKGFSETVRQLPEKEDSKF